MGDNYKGILSKQPAQEPTRAVSLSPSHTHTKHLKRYLLQRRRQIRTFSKPHRSPHLQEPDKPWRKWLLPKDRVAKIQPKAAMICFKYQNICLFWKVSGLKQGGRRNQISQTTLNPPRSLLPFVPRASKSEVCCGLNLENCQRSKEDRQVAYCCAALS